MNYIHGRAVAEATEEITLDEFQKLVRTDKNGTRYISDGRCGRCGGSGYLPYRVDNGVCWGCGGNGWGKAHMIKVYTPEYAEKLQKKVEEKAAKKREELKAGAEEVNQKFFLYNGFNENGKTWVVLGNTYDIKDELKELGAKFSKTLGWHLTNDTDKYPTIEIDVEDLYYKDSADRYFGMGMEHRKTLWYEGAPETEWIEIWEDNKAVNYEVKIDYETASRKIKEANDKVVAEQNAQNPSKHFGEVGKRAKGLKLTYKGCKTWKNTFDPYGGCTFLHKFEDENQNQFLWKTANPLERVFNGEYRSIEEGETIEVTATIKAHSDYNGIQQTELTRVKVTG